METNFDKAFKVVIGIEGGYVNNQYDRGGETKYGISKRAYPNLDIKNLTLEDAKRVYYRDYWIASGIEYIDDYKIQLELFDTAVNMGTYKAKTILQEALNLLNRNERNFKDLIVDGQIGRITISAYNKVNKEILLKVLNGLQFMNYVRIVENDKSQEIFMNGWMRRVYLKPLYMLYKEQQQQEDFIGISTLAYDELLNKIIIIDAEKDSKFVGFWKHWTKWF